MVTHLIFAKFYVSIKYELDLPQEEYDASVMVIYIHRIVTHKKKQ